MAQQMADIEHDHVVRSCGQKSLFELINVSPIAIAWVHEDISVDRLVYFKNPHSR